MAAFFFLREPKRNKKDYQSCWVHWRCSSSFFFLSECDSTTTPPSSFAMRLSGLYVWVSCCITTVPFDLAARQGLWNFTIHLYAYVDIYMYVCTCVCKIRAKTGGMMIIKKRQKTLSMSQFQHGGMALCLAWPCQYLDWFLPSTPPPLLVLHAFLLMSVSCDGAAGEWWLRRFTSAEKKRWVEARRT